MLTILFDGIAYGMLLFVLACGLAVTLGLMNFVNLAHGAFAMAGGYVTAVLMNRYGVPFLLTLPLAFAVPAVIGLVLERTLYKQLYARSHLDQVLFSIGLVFMAVAAVDYTMGSQQQMIQIPAWLQGRVEILGIQVGLYRSFIIAVCGVLVVVLQYILTQTRFGSRLRAAVDDPRVARGLGINVSVIFAATFAVGSGLAGLGGALGAEILGLDPDVPAQVHDLLSDRRHGRRHHQHHRPVSGLPHSRDRRCRRQVLRAEPGRLRHLHAHDRRSRSSPTGPFRPCALTR